ncbi:hypothetical protein BJ508DRAFT_416426 [Ascobolus immersus RN42]|uniref:Pyruvate dehydrogenase protein x component n=1 Tax=Ascobolus immersus RN42 TaxID=1160509 RepID=A0A3N4HXX3_ASCIM|nr:hypothetical protein BJ508DRAFT_416426 [Ascobolus immersus RN42]
MTEGSIISWKKKEGEAFTAGEVLLEIETDKATMDVEAQDDGILAKILVGDGSKGVQVGARIAVTAEEGDDLASLDIPKDESAAESSAKGSETKKVEAKEAPKKVEKPLKGVENAKPAEGAPLKLDFTPSPSVAHLLKEKGISSEDAKNIPTSGPKGRMLKGDVLAYLGKINKEHPQQLSSSINKLAHLDLSNIKIKPRPKKEAATPGKPGKAAEEIKEVAIPLAFPVQGELLIQAAQEANKRVPVTTGPSPADLFNELVGAPVKASRKPNTFQVEVRPAKTIVKEANIYDVLVGKANPRAPPKKVVVGPELLTVKIGKGQTEKQGKQFLEEITHILQAEQPRL